ncbi:hypothetical protein D1871_06425 [Nakamurella silvestris]|nr:hypothetical protein D1871_06425 [Nakamurella silvestris]
MTVRSTALAAAVLLLAGCGNSSPDASPSTDTAVGTASSSTEPTPSGTGTTDAPGTTASPPQLPTSFPEMTVDTTESDALQAVDVINGALLKAGDLGTGFAKAAYTPPDPTDRTALLPCGQVNTAAMFPNALRTGTKLVDGTTAQMDQTVTLFLDEETAKAAFEHAVAGYSCTEGLIGDAPVGITDGGDLTTQIGGDKAHAWAATIGDEAGVLVVVQQGRLTQGFTYVMGAGVEMKDVPNPIEAATLAVKKMQEAGF